jgi:hypothetical protein
MRHLLWMGFSAILSLITGCSSGPAASSGGHGGAGGAGGSGGASGVSGMPCDVETVLAARCVSCHANPPVAGAPMPLVNYDDLTAHTKTDPGKTYVDVSIARMESAASPMPPQPSAPATATEIETLKAWAAAGLPRGDCAVSTGPDPFGAPPACTSQEYWTLGNAGVAEMNPGMACIACHESKPDGLSPPIFLVAGTVYVTGHEPDLCSGGPPEGADPAIVEITDADGVATVVPLSSGGNFFLNPGAKTLALPYTAKVRTAGKERAMKSPQTSGDCNSCHTQNGESGAPGRIVLP